MIAKIIKDKKEYVSYIFCTFNPGWNEVVIVFDHEQNQFECIRVYDITKAIKRRVFIFDTSQDEWIQENLIKLSRTKKLTSISGYPWLVNCPERITKILNQQRIEDEYYQLAKNFNENINQATWTYVLNDMDIENLMSAAWDFHDAYINKITYEPEGFYQVPSKIQVIFSGCWNCSIILEFIGDVLIHMYQDDDCSREILDSSVFFEDGYIYWVDNDINNFKEISLEDQYFRARALRWKFEIEKENY